MKGEGKAKAQATGEEVRKEDTKMRCHSRIWGLVVATALLAVLPAVSIRVPAQNAQAQKGAFEGEIMDEHCAQMGSHNMTMKANQLATPDLCTSFCVYFQKSPGKYVLFNAATKAIYQLDDQEQVSFFADRKVKVSGTYDPATKTIHVSDLKSVSVS
jgi:hypothetical protein